MFFDMCTGEDILDHQFLSKEEIARRGYGADHLKAAAVFPRDGNFPPYLDVELDQV